LSRTAYVDASALVKLAVAEPESEAMFRWLAEADSLAISRVGLVETARAVARSPHDSAHLRRTLGAVVAIELDERTAHAAATVAPPSLRSLDAIHLATAIGLGPELDAFVTYDDRLAAAARALGLPVVRPAGPGGAG
jgi:predicted nucleic acid-binding protein